MVISEKKIPRMLLVKKQSLECYWWIYDPSIVIGEKTIPTMLLVKNDPSNFISDKKKNHNIFWWRNWIQDSI